MTDEYDEDEYPFSEREFRRLLDIRDIMDPGARRVLEASVVMTMVTDLREARAEYLAMYALVRERGHDFQEDPELLAAIDAEIARWQAILDEDED